MAHKYDYLLFDLDNTLLDFDASSHKAFGAIIPHNNAQELEELYSKYRVINKRIWEELEAGLITFDELRANRWAFLFSQVGIDDLDPLETNERYFDFIKSDLVYVDGADELIQELVAVDYPLGIITNGLSDVQWPRLSLSSFDKIFDPIVISNEIGVAKPESDFFEYTFSKLKTKDKSKVLVIGDTYNSDIIGGNQFGFKTCWYDPHQKNNKQTIAADFIIRDLRELMTVVL